jgi:hypothetical protein
MNNETAPLPQQMPFRSAIQGLVRLLIRAIPLPNILEILNNCYNQIRTAPTGTTSRIETRPSSP